MAKSSHGLWFPSAHAEFEVHRSRASRLAEFRLQGLITLLAAYALEFLAGFVSHRQHSWDLTLRRQSPARVTETHRPGRTRLALPRRYFRHAKRRIGSPDLAFWVRASRNCLAAAERVRPAVQAPPMGFAPLQGMFVKAFRRTSPAILSRA
jgi:hypothetical protein